jgi:C4-dicarboxylate-specific signal transduction histidine kinase
MGNLSRHLEQEREQMGKEVASLSQHIGHIKEIVSMQQTYARPAGVYEKVPLPDLMEDLQGLSRPGIERHDIQFRIEDDFSAPITTDRHKVLQILLNLVSNAKDAVKVRDASERRITIHIVRVGEERMAIRVTDNGIGILPANRVRIFSHGFTTKADGHGFGLHSSALAAKQLRGSLTVESEGSNRGATFVLELPIDVNATAQGRMSS